MSETPDQRAARLQREIANKAAELRAQERAVRAAKLAAEQAKAAKAAKAAERAARQAKKNK